MIANSGLKTSKSINDENKSLLRPISSLSESWSILHHRLSLNLVIAILFVLIIIISCEFQSISCASPHNHLYQGKVSINRSSTMKYTRNVLNIILQFNIQKYLLYQSSSFNIHNSQDFHYHNTIIQSFIVLIQEYKWLNSSFMTIENAFIEKKIFKISTITTHFYSFYIKFWILIIYFKIYLSRIQYTSYSSIHKLWTSILFIFLKFQYHSWPNHSYIISFQNLLSILPKIHQLNLDLRKQYDQNN